jgi:hypothetical protein
MNSWITVSFYSYFISNSWRMQKIWSEVFLLSRKPYNHTIYIYIYIYIYIHMNSTSREWYVIKFCMKLIAVPTIISFIISFVTLLINWYNNRFLRLILEFFLIPNRINECVDHSNIWPLVWSNSAEYDPYMMSYTFCTLLQLFQTQDDRFQKQTSQLNAVMSTWRYWSYVYSVTESSFVSIYNLIEVDDWEREVHIIYSYMNPKYI